VYESVELLKKFEASEVPDALEGAAQVYQELPFVYRPGERAVHGVIDVLYLDREGVWHVLDYKTAPVSYDGAWGNARHYYLQVGVYASAVAAKTGQTPKVQLYYIHPGRLITIRPADWQAALARLDDDVRSALNS
jgi:ATP-dependent exoDNAse (exonuclease V) beta subunit